MRIYIFIASLFYLVLYVKTCPFGCNTCTSREIWCENANLKQFPSNIPANITLLYMVGNSISTIPDQAMFSFRKTLKTWYMSKNQLKYEGIGKQGFRQLIFLQSLDLSRNFFTSIRADMFAGMRTLRELYLKNNRISRIYPEAFANMTNLRDLQLSGNRIVSVPLLTGIPALLRLYLDNNEIKTISYSFIKLPHLSELSVAGNHLQKLEADAFAEKSEISWLNISNNLFKVSPSAISNFSQLRGLYLSGNPISNLPADLLANANPIKVLDISAMQLTSLERGFLPRGRILNTIRIGENPWTCDCHLRHLLDFITEMKDSFNDLLEAKCARPPSKRGLLLKDLHLSDLGCKETEQPESKNEDPCSLVTCFNGGFCVIDGNTASCKCATGWRGRACNDQITINSSPTNQSDDEDLQDTLLLEKDSITVDSVTIQVPQLGAEYLIRVLELTDDRGGLLERQSYHIRPIKRNQRVSGLASGATYKVCLVSLLAPSDKLCSTIQTSIQSTTSSVILETFTQQKTIVDEKDGEFDKEEEQKQTQLFAGVGAASRGEPSNFLENHNQSVYLLVGAGIGALVILVSGALIFLFLRNKKKKIASSKHQQMSPLEKRLRHPSPSRYPTHYPNGSLGRSSISGGSTVGHVTSQPLLLLERSSPLNLAPAPNNDVTDEYVAMAGKGQQASMSRSVYFYGPTHPNEMSGRSHTPICPPDPYRTSPLVTSRINGSYATTMTSLVAGGGAETKPLRQSLLTKSSITSCTIPECYSRNAMTSSVVE